MRFLENYRGKQVRKGEGLEQQIGGGKRQANRCAVASHWTAAPRKDHGAGPRLGTLR